ncbi:glycosyltransferase family 10 domain-containing protein [Butyrivibrio sp.]|uniref:glycosyltransferase family 10 domain-containing protein n=1 Tax=Butyrivibrio sp. TaxID=28121 RepID=UPI0025BF74DD|nr:glycosyltransferase family 10 [Butyrivibrio sp.]
MMKRIAIVPWDDSIKKDSVYIPREDGYKGTHVLFAEAFRSRGIEFHTIDCYEKLEDIDCFLFFSVNYKWYKEIMQRNLLDRAFYCSAEPPVVVPKNTKEGYAKLLKWFGGILTWNYDLVDNRRIFKRNIPFDFVKRYGDVDYKDRKLITSISGNKTSDNENELYSEREKVIIWLENNHKEDFDFYGTGWDSLLHPCYKGTVYDKCITYHGYRFAICFENSKNIRGYVTEKICDCLCSGIVPIYLGADDVSLYIPKEAFIDYSEYSSLEDLYAYLKNMSEKEYMGYIDAAKKYVDNPNEEMFSADVLCREVIYAYENCQADVAPGFSERVYVYKKYILQATDKMLLNLRIKASKVKRKLRIE